MAEDVRVVIDADARAVVVEAGKAKAAIRGLGNEAQSVTRAGAAFNAAGRRQAETLNELGRAARRSTLALGALAGAGLAHLIKTGVDFEKQMSAVNAVTNATGKQFEALKKQAMDAGRATAFSAGEAAKAQEELAKGGLSVKNILDGGLNSSLALAAAGSLELGEAAAITANSMNLFGLSGKESAKVADALATAANKTTADVSDFGMALSQSGAVAKSAGLDFNETVVVLEALAAAGIKNSDAGTSLKTALIQLIKPTDQQAELSKKLGLSFVAANGEMKSMSDISAMLRDKLKDQGAAQRTATLATLAGTDGVRTLTALYDAGPRKLDAYARGLEKTGTAAEVARKKQDNVAGAFEQLTGSIESVEAALFGQFQKPLKEALLEATRVVNTQGKEVEEFFDRVFDMPEFQAADLGGKLGILLDEFDRTGLPDKMRDLIVEGFTNGLNAAIPIVIDGAAALAVAGAKAFGQAFIDGDPLSRVLLTGYLLHKTGALAAFRTFGKQAGTQMAVGAAAGAGGPAVAGGWKASAKSMGKTFGITAAVAAAIAYGPEFAKKAKQGLSTSTPDFNLPKGRTLKGLAPKLPLGLEKTGLLSIVGKLTDPGLAKLDGVDDKLAKFGNTAEKTFKQLAKANDTRGLAELAEDARRMAKEFPEAAGALNAFADTADRAAGSASDQFALMRAAAGKNLNRISQTVSDTSFEIRQRFGPDTQKAKDALSRNFMLAAQAIKRSMKDGVISSKTGLAEIDELFVKALSQYGFSRTEAINRARGKEFSGKSTATTVNKARGGLIQVGRAGDSARDDVPAVLNGTPAVIARGEQVAVFNRHQQAEMDHRLADQGGLAGFFQRNQRPHYMAAGGIVGKYAPGGIVPIPGMPGESIHRSILGDVMQIIRKYRARVTDGYATSGHAANGEHPKGLAVDLVPGAGGSWDDITALANWAEPQQNNPRSPFRWVGYTGDAGHGSGDHLHLSWLANATMSGKLGGALADKLKRVLLKGRGGALGAVGQGALDVTLGAAQARLDSLGEGGGVEGAESGGRPVRGSLKDLNRAFPRHFLGDPNAVQLSPQQVAAIAKSQGLPGDTFEKISRGESQHYPGVQQRDPGDGMVGYGLWQMTPNAWGAGSAAQKRMQSLGGIPAMFNPIRNAMMAKFLYEAAPTKTPGAKGFPWYGTQYLASGGLIRAAGGVTVPKPKRQPTRGTNRTPRDRGGKSKFKPLRYRGKILDAVPELGQIVSFDEQLERASRRYDEMARGFALTDEEPLMTDAAGNEIRNEGDIERRVGEIDQLIGQKGLTAKLLANQRTAAQTAAAKVAEAIRERQERIADVMDAAKRNKRRITDAQKDINEERRGKGWQGKVSDNDKRIDALQDDLRAESSKKKGSRDLKLSLRNQIDELQDENKRLRKEKPKGGDGKRVGRLSKRLDALRDEREELVGSRSVADDAQADGGLLGNARSGLESYREAQGDGKSGLMELVGRILPDGAVDIGFDIAELQKEREQWTGTKAPAVSLPGADRDDQGLADLLKGQLADEKAKNRMLAQQFGVFQGFGPMLSGRMLGSFARGLARVPETGMALLHKDEMVVPDEKGPFGSQVSAQAGPVSIELRFDGNSGQLVKLIDARVDGRTTRMLNDTARKSRLIAGARGF